MASTADICNLALARILHSETIASLDTERSQTANILRIFYPMVLEQVLREFPWKFARRRVALADTGAPPSNWAFSYAYPTGCAQVLALVLPGMRVPRRDMQPAFEVASDGARRVIYTDQQEAEAVYTELVSDPSRFDALFVSFFAWRLAAEVAAPLSAKVELAKNASNQAVMAKSLAGSVDLSEEWMGAEPECEFLAARR